VLLTAVVELCHQRGLREALEGGEHIETLARVLVVVGLLRPPVAQHAKGERRAWRPAQATHQRLVGVVVLHHVPAVDEPQLRVELRSELEVGTDAHVGEVLEIGELVAHREVRVEHVVDDLEAHQRPHLAGLELHVVVLVAKRRVDRDVGLGQVAVAAEVEGAVVDQRLRHLGVGAEEQLEAHPDVHLVGGREFLDAQAKRVGDETCRGSGRRSGR
jgi:hypothetical protein